METHAFERNFTYIHHRKTNEKAGHYGRQRVEMNTQWRQTQTCKVLCLVQKWLGQPLRHLVIFSLNKSNPWPTLLSANSTQTWGHQVSISTNTNFHIHTPVEKELVSLDLMVFWHPCMLMTQQNCKTELAIHILGQVQGKGQTVSIMKSANGIISLIPINLKSQHRNSVVQKCDQAWSLHSP